MSRKAKSGIVVGDCLEVLKQLPDKRVQCVVTSPPYWGLRDYGTVTWEGGDPECDHSSQVNYGKKSDTNKGSLRNGPFKEVCGKCGAKRVDDQLGLEKTPEEYVAKLVEIFREIKRVLRDDGTVWLNLGDSYAGSGKGGNPEDSKWSGFVGNKDREKSAKASNPIIPTGLKPKDLVGIPWKVAFALQAEGWYLRQDCISLGYNKMGDLICQSCREIDLKKKSIKGTDET